MLRSGRADQERNFSLSDLATGDHLKNASRLSAQEFFVDLRHLARDYDRTSAAEDLDDLCERLFQPVRGLIEDFRGGRGADGFEFASSSPGLGRQEGTEAKRVGWQTTGSESGNDRGRPGHRNHGNSTFDGLFYNPEAGIRNARRAGICDQR